jgi:hypothetical protein
MISWSRNLTDDFSADLEKVLKEADAAEKIPSAEKESDESLEEQKPRSADERVTDPVETSHADNASPDSGNSASTAQITREMTEGQKEIATRSTIEDADDKTEDISNDIDDILKEITSDDDDAVEKTMVDENTMATEKKMPDPVLEPVQAPEHPAGKNDESAGAEEKSATADPTNRQRKVTNPPTVRLQSPIGTTKPLRETSASTRSRKKKTVIASAVIILSLSLAGYFFWNQKNSMVTAIRFPVPDSNRTQTMVESETAPRPQELVVDDYIPSDESRLKTAAETLAQLRRDLIEKHAEIEELRTYYQSGIDAEVQGILDVARETGKKRLPFEAAMDEPHINLGLAAIQRRQTYLEKLETPAQRLFWNSEELLFFSRKAEFLALMAGKTSDIDIDGFIQQANEIINAHRSTLAQLNIDEVSASPQSLETIWKNIAKGMASAPVKPEKKRAAAETDNASIWENICDGDFSRKHNLTALSPEAARCLSNWKGKDLFLNALTVLSPESARQLANWEGDWLGLNGLTELSPEAAEHLSRWKGKGLSLNGLSRLSPRVVAILSEWQGDQIELVNVKHMAHWENPKTQLFLSEDLKRKRLATRK